MWWAIGILIIFFSSFCLFEKKQNKKTLPLPTSTPNSMSNLILYDTDDEQEMKPKRKQKKINVTSKPTIPTTLSTSTTTFMSSQPPFTFTNLWSEPAILKPLSAQLPSVPQLPISELSISQPQLPISELSISQPQFPPCTEELCVSQPQLPQPISELCVSQPQLPQPISELCISQPQLQANNRQSQLNTQSSPFNDLSSSQQESTGTQSTLPQLVDTPSNTLTRLQMMHLASYFHSTNLSCFAAAVPIPSPEANELHHHLELLMKLVPPDYSQKKPKQNTFKWKFYFLAISSLQVIASTLLYATVAFSH